VLSGLFLFVFFLVGALSVRVTDDASEAMLPTDAATVAQYDDYLDRFPSDQGALVVFEGLLCSEPGWQLMIEAERAYAAHSLIDRTVSLMSKSTRYVQGSGDTLDMTVFRDLEFANGQARCDAAQGYTPYRKVLVAENAAASAMFLIAQGDTDAVTFSREMQAIAAPFVARASALGGRVILTGEAVMSAELSNVIAQDSVLIGLVLLLMLVLLFAFTRSWLAVWCAALLNIFVLTVTYGFMGWLKLELTAATSLVVFLLVPLASAFVVHAYGYVVRADDKSQAPRAGQTAFVMAGISTAIGFACTGFTPAPDVQMLALMGVVGIAAAAGGVFLIVFPLLLTRPDFQYVVRFGITRGFLGNPAYGYILLAALTLTTALGLSQLKIDYGPSNYLPLSNPVRADFEAAGKWFGRMSLPLMIEVDDAEDPQPWIALKPLIEQLYARYPQGFQASWFYDHMAELTQAFTRDGANPGIAFPVDAATFAQLVLWFDPTDLELFMDEDRERILVLFQVPYLGSHDYYAMKDLVTTYLADHAIEGYFVGRVSSFFETGHRIGFDNLRGLAIGAVLIFGLLYALFRSIPLALIGILANALPVMSGLAALGTLGIPIDMGSSVVAAMAFGIVLDDSTHLLVRVQQLVRSGYDPSTAVVRAVADLIAPIMTTTGMICAGFLVLYFAEMRPFSDFATVILMTMISALITDVLILPLLVRRFMPDPIKAR
jgi:predicted RND superfamily exporter protein